MNYAVDAFQFNVVKKGSAHCHNTVQKCVHFFIRYGKISRISTIIKDSGPYELSCYSTPLLGGAYPTEEEAVGSLVHWSMRTSWTTDNTLPAATGLLSTKTGSWEKNCIHVHNISDGLLLKRLTVMHLRTQVIIVVQHCILYVLTACPTTQKHTICKRKALNTLSCWKIIE